VVWGLDGTLEDLNSLLSPTDASLWTLTSAYAISDSNWVTGVGTYDPDGSGPLASYTRAFSMQVSVPEPASLGVLGTGACRCSFGEGADQWLKQVVGSGRAAIRYSGFAGRDSTPLQREESAMCRSPLV
jgi:hypothetical protein